MSDETIRMVGKARGDMEALMRDVAAKSGGLVEVGEMLGMRLVQDGQVAVFQDVSGKMRIELDVHESMESGAFANAGHDFANCATLPHGVMDWTPGASFGPSSGLFGCFSDVDASVTEICKTLTEADR